MLAARHDDDGGYRIYLYFNSTVNNDVHSLISMMTITSINKSKVEYDCSL